MRNYWMRTRDRHSTSPRGKGGKGIAKRLGPFFGLYAGSANLYLSDLFAQIAAAYAAQATNAVVATGCDVFFGSD